jgi:hypothetical protein
MRQRRNWDSNPNFDDSQNRGSKRTAISPANLPHSFALAVVYGRRIAMEQSFEAGG